MGPLAQILITVAISAAGGLLAHLAQLPAGWLMGGSLAVAIAALCGVKVGIPGWLRDGTFLLTGMSMGASVARDSLGLVAQWPLSFAALLFELIVIVAATGYMLRRLFGLDRGTAYLSSFPGHLPFVMGIAAAGVGDPRQITIIQVIRILMLTVCVPVGALFLPIGEVPAPHAAAEMSLATLLPVGALCVAAGFVFHKLRVSAGYSLGAMAAATAAKLSGVFDGAMPAPLVLAAFVLMGAVIGSRFNGITVAEFRRAAVGGLLATLMTVAIVSITAYGVSRLVGLPFGQIWLGLAPGGIEGMGALGIAFGFDTAFIAAHHVARLLLLTFAIPMVAVLVRDRPQAELGT